MKCLEYVKVLKITAALSQQSTPFLFLLIQTYKNADDYQVTYTQHSLKLQMNWIHTSGESERFPAGLDNKKEHETFCFPLDQSCSAQRMRRSCY